MSLPQQSYQAWQATFTGRLGYSVRAEWIVFLSVPARLPSPGAAEALVYKSRNVSGQSKAVTYLTGERPRPLMIVWQELTKTDTIRPGLACVVAGSV